MSGLQFYRLVDRAVPAGPFLAESGLNLDARSVIQATAAPAHALKIDIFAGKDLRQLWEGARWAELPDLPAAEADARITEFLSQNPPYRGEHWISAQEAALRVLHLARAAVRLNVAKAASPGLRAVVDLHLHRVRVSRLYEESQDNNHGISCAAACVVGYLLLGQSARATRAVRRLQKLLRRLVAPCGAFSQHSVRYHRMVVDILAIVQECAAHFHLSADLGDVQAAMCGWLNRLTDPVSGGASRIGHDDGTALNAPPLPTGTQRPRRWSGRGFMGFSGRQGLWAVLRTPGSRHRPAHADLLHLDLWRDGVNLLRDSGTGAYNHTWWPQWFPSVRAHNTVTFDDAEQMPRIGRFLMGPWPRGGVLPNGGWVEDKRGNRHQRCVRMQDDVCHIEDTLSGPYRHAVLRWHLPQTPVILEHTTLSVSGAQITIAGATSVWVEEAPDSPAYGTVQNTPVLCAAVPAGDARIVTILCGAA